MAPKSQQCLFFTALFCLALNCSAAVDVGVLVGDFPPTIDSVKTYCSYLDDSSNVPCTSFSDGCVVYVQIKVSDLSGSADVTADGFVKAKIVLLNGTQETDFSRFGSSYLNATIQSSSGAQATYIYAFPMSTDDPDRTGTESPPLFYRVKAQVSDGVSTVTSNSSNATQNADYAYHVSPVPPPPPGPDRFLFDVTIDVPEDKRTLRPGDSFYATVAVTKLSPPGVNAVTLIYRISDPRNLTVDYYSETVVIGDSTLYRIPLMRIPDDAISGFYVFKVSVSYVSIVAWSEAVFNVIAAPTTTRATTTTTLENPTTLPITTTTTSGSTTTTRRESGGGGGGGGGRVINYPVPVPPSEVKKEVALTKYPAEVSGFQGDSKPVMVVVENRGDVVIDDLTIQLGGPASVVKVTPKNIETIDAGSKRIFILDIKIPDSISSGNYDMTLKAIGDGASDERYVKLVILDRPKEPEPELQKKLSDMSRLIDDVWAEAVSSGLGENDQKMSKVFDSLRRAKESLAKAREEWTNRDYNQTDLALNETRSNIEESVVQLAVVSPKDTDIKEVRSVTETTVYSLPPLYWVIALTAIIVTIFLAYERARRLGPGKKLEERYDLRRMKDMVFGRISRPPGGGSNPGSSLGGKKSV